MNASVREVYILAERVLTVIGVPAGAAPAAARLVVGAEIRTGEGLRCLLEQSSRELPNVHPEVVGETPATITLDCKGLPAPVVGFSALDLCQVKALESGVGAVLMQRVAAPSLLLALELHTAQRGLTCTLLERSGRAGFQPLAAKAPLIPEGDCLLICYRDTNAARGPDDDLRDSGRGYWWLVGDVEAGGPSPERAAMTNGVEVDYKLWQDLWTRSYEYLAPESERSRLDAGPFSG